MDSYFIVWCICVVVAWKIGAQKGEGLGGFLAGVLFGPLGVLFALASSGRRGAPGS